MPKQCIKACCEVLMISNLKMKAMMHTTNEGEGNRIDIRYWNGMLSVDLSIFGE